MSETTGRTDPQPTGGPGITRFATRGQHRLSYESSGAAAGPAVLALHDLLADRGQFRPLAEALTASGFRVSLPDARGHGASAMLSGRDYPARELAADALAVLDAEGIRAVRVVALGWGAMTALALAAIARERVVSLVLAEPVLPALLSAPDGEARAIGRKQLEIVREAATAAEKGLTDRALDLYLGMRLGEGWRDDLPRPRLGAIRRAAASLAPLLAGMAADPIEGEAPRRLDLPVTLLVRADAPDVERATREALAALLSQVRIETVTPETGERSIAAPQWTAAVARALAIPGA